MKITLQNMARRTVDALKKDNIPDVAQIVYRELAKQKKLNQLDRFIEIAKKKYYQKEGLVLAEAASRAKISEKGLTELQVKIEKRTGKKVALENVIDPDLIGGIKIRIEDEVIDMSYRGLLEKLNSRLAGEV